MLPFLTTRIGMSLHVFVCVFLLVVLYWLLKSSVQKQALRIGEIPPFHACKLWKVGVQSDVVDSILMLAQRYFHVMEKFLVWLVW